MQEAQAAIFRIESMRKDLTQSSIIFLLHEKKKKEKREQKKKKRKEKESIDNQPTSQTTGKDTER